MTHTHIRFDHIAFKESKFMNTPTCQLSKCSFETIQIIMIIIIYEVGVSRLAIINAIVHNCEAKQLTVLTCLDHTLINFCSVAINKIARLIPRSLKCCRRARPCVISHWSSQSIHKRHRCLKLTRHAAA